MSWRDNLSTSRTDLTGGAETSEDYSDNKKTSALPIWVLIFIILSFIFFQIFLMVTKSEREVKRNVDKFIYWIVETKQQKPYATIYEPGYIELNLYYDKGVIGKDGLAMDEDEWIKFTKKDIALLSNFTNEKKEYAVIYRILIYLYNKRALQERTK